MFTCVLYDCHKCFDIRAEIVPVLNCERLVLKINGIPIEADGLAAAQAVEYIEENWKLQLCTFGYFKEPAHLYCDKDFKPEKLNSDW